ncbi:hypothetical protein [Herbaspirillum autotrophicum]|uniref:hypothetical protein n=1 Tax=Herbaspirillum autotrophicum TaxID=180195 RepID=UPI00067C2823|nr:hypothetical protein [Herbaspirillum autotrophicum]
MTDDQYQRLQALTEKLMDVFLSEADPDSWPGAGIKPNAMDKETRGNRYWCKKDAAATLTLNMRAITMIDAIHRRTPEDGEPLGAGAPEGADAEDSLDSDIARAEKQAEKLMEKMRKKGLHPQA